MATDWSALWQRFKGQWVALGEDETTVLGSGHTAREALTAARKKGHSHPILTRMPSTLGNFAGHV